jgi:hypothetical protein
MPRSDFYVSPHATSLARHCERSEAIQCGTAALDCFVAPLLAMTV